MVTKPEMSQQQWDEVVEWWNGLGEVLREEMRGICKRDRHRWYLSPLADQELCIQCCTYREAKA